MIDAVRVPPSACRMSQSIRIEFSPIWSRRVTPRSERPIRRWISWVRPDSLPFADSRSVRTEVDRGSSAYSAVTQPVPEPCRNRGTFASHDAAASTRVLPISNSTLPSAHSR